MRPEPNARQKFATARRWHLAALLILISGCGGGGSGPSGPSGPSITVSGKVTTSEGTPVPNIAIASYVTSYCPIPYPPYATAYESRGQSTTDAAGRYVVATYVADYCMNVFDVSVQPGNNCDASKTNPCYEVGSPSGATPGWSQNDFSPSTDVNFVAERRYKAFGVVLFPNGLTQPWSRKSDLMPVLDIDPIAGGSGSIDDAGAFNFRYLRNGVTYTVYFPQVDCSLVSIYACDAAYNFDRTEITFTVSSSDVDNLVFTATPAGGVPSPTPSYVDTSFGTNGVFTRHGASKEVGFDLIADPDGGYYVVGSSGGLGAIWGLTEGGALDTRFNATGFRTNGFGAFEQGLFAGGKLYASTGYRSWPGTTLVCVTDTGANCAGFNSGASLAVPTPDGSLFPFAMSRDPNSGDLLRVGGYGRLGPAHEVIQALEVTRVSAAGTLGATYTDTSPLGIVGHNYGEGIIVAGNGSAYVTGSAPVDIAQSYSYRAYVLRLTNAMTLDTTFNPGGRVPGILELGIGYASPVALDATGAVLVAVGGSVTRVTTAGAVDTSFATAGTLTTSMWQIVKIVVDGAGRIVVIGRPFGGKARVCRYSSSGVLDRSFNTGCVTLGPPTYSEADTISGTVDSSNRILVMYHTNRSEIGLEMVVQRIIP